ncbi:MAG: (Fe-S)-binding protein, partial [Chloroflexi bacterium]|nr:(Fe-S)-binding protein [Chloroflexota bacterium]
KCTNCGVCLEVCPVFPLTKYVNKGAKAVMESITALLKGGPVTPEAYDMAFFCNTACAACSKACPEGLSPHTAFPAAIARINRAGWPLPAYAYQFTPQHPHNFASVFSALQMKPSDHRWFSRFPPNPEPVDVVFFTGCNVVATPHTVLDIMGILDAMKINYVTVAGGDICCGSGPMSWGDLEKAETIGREFVTGIASFRPKTAVFFCHGCYMLSTGILPKLIPVPFQSYELAQFLLENLDRLPLRHSLNKTVTVHDSCSSVLMGMTETTRKLLGAIPGVSLVEMKHNRSNALCCGGLTNINRPEHSEPLRRAPLAEAKATGAEVMATICTGCQLSFAPLQSDYSLQVQSYINLVAASVGVSHVEAA